jgi:general secretion pathway protein C
MIVSRVASYLKRNGWVLNLVFTVMGAYFVAGALNTVVARQLRVVPGVEDGARGGRGRDSRNAGRLSSRVEFEHIASRNLFNIKREDLAPVEEAPDEPVAVVGADYDPNDLKDCSISGELRGTLVAGEATEWSAAVIYHKKGRQTRVYSVRPGHNEIEEDATLVEIGLREIIVRRSEHYERCTTDDKGKGKSSRHDRKAKRRGSSKSEEDKERSGVSKVSETEYAIERTELDSVLGNLSKVATQARIVPSFKNGKPNGFKLFSIKPGSIYSKIGLKNGDVIQKVNGYEMNSPDKALEIYQKLKEANSVTVDMVRRGRPRTMNYSIGR